MLRENHLLENRLKAPCWNRGLSGCAGDPCPNSPPYGAQASSAKTDYNTMLLFNYIPYFPTV